jgi:probable HAF family extracellular repeat protein
MDPPRMRPAALLEGIPVLRPSSFVVLLCLVLAPLSAARAQPSLTGVASVGLSPFNNGSISGDGSMLVGSRPSGTGIEAVYWEVGTSGAAAVVVSLGVLLPPSGPPPTASLDRAVAASSDGSVIVGEAKNKDGQTEAFRWAGAGMVGLGFLESQTSSTAVDVSADGSVVAGNSPLFGAVQAFVWNGGVPQPLGDLEGGDFYSQAMAISADGAVVVGRSRSTDGEEAFRWTEAGGMVGLGDLPGGTVQSIATDVSADGSVVVGWGQAGDGQRAFRWTAATGIQPLPLPPVLSSRAWGVSPDGSVVLGEYKRDALSAQSAFVWDVVNGFRDLTQLLLDEAVVLDPDWVFPFQQALSISADGSVLRGTGTQNSVGFQDFVVTGLTMVPEPAPAALAALATLAGLAARRAAPPASG